MAHMTAVLIPSLHPDDKLVPYVHALQKAGFKRLVIVDDGSGPDRKYQSIFDELRTISCCTVLSYEINRGKGYALKHGLAYIRENLPEVTAVITADSDGQHLVEDVMSVERSLQKNPHALVLGSRDFSLKNVPPKSRFGNRTTSFFFYLLYGRWLPDTQTGLRGISADLIPFLLSIPGDRFEYEMNMLTHASKEKIPFVIAPIQTVYLEANKSTHFRAFHDSVRIYRHLFGTFFRYMGASILSFLLDNGLFTLLDDRLLDFFFQNRLRGLDANEYWHTIIAAAVARIASSIFNYQCNKSFVFNAKGSRRTAVRYALLCVFSLIVSAALTNALHLLLSLDRTPVKIVVDTLLYFVNFRIQKAWVFHSASETTR